MSSEREVSLNSGRNVYENLEAEYFEGILVFMDTLGKFWILPWQLISQNTTVDVIERLEKEARPITYEELRNEIDFAFISLHGKYGDDGCIQGLLELLGIPYTGSGVLASAIGMDKHIQQKVLQAAGLAVPESIIIRRTDWFDKRDQIIHAMQQHLKYPVFTKPIREGSSMGVTLVRDETSLEAGILDALRWDNAVLVEEYLDGTEFSCIVIENHGQPAPLELTEIHPESDYYTYDDKYMPGRCRKFTPPKNFSPEVTSRIKEEVLKAYEALGFRNYGRIDGFLLKDERILITDPNSSSGMAPSSFFFEQAACAGLLPSMIVTRLIQDALKIHRVKRGPL
jgi:D-alanine-D-alanine ligase